MNAALDELQDDPKIELAIFGREVEQFIETDRIGQYLVAKAKEDIATAAQALLEADPENPRAIRELQFKARVAEAVRGWLAQAIADGENAAQAVQQERDSRG